MSIEQGCHACGVKRFGLLCMISFNIKKLGQLAVVCRGEDEGDAVRLPSVIGRLTSRGEEEVGGWV